MFRLFHDVNIDWLGKRRFFIGLSILLMLAGMGTALYRHRFHPNGSDAFNLGVDFKRGTVLGTEAVSAIASSQLRTQAIAVTIAALVGMLLFIAFRFEWTYGASAVIAVFHTVLVTLGLFSIFQIEINLTVIAALLTLVGFDVNDSIVIFDRIRENRKLYRRMSLYDVTNLSINQTLSRTVITSGLVFLSVVSLVLLGGETLRPFSLALLMGILFGTYDTIAVAGPIMVWWERKLEAANKLQAAYSREAGLHWGSVKGSSKSVGKPSRAA